jgi:2'-5' RNA ligase
MAPSRYPFHRLFLGFRPPAAILSEIAAIRDYFLPRRPVPDSRLHITLLPFPLHEEFPQLLARHVVGALSADELPVCRVILDRLVLGARIGLLQPSEPVPGLQAFQKQVARKVLTAGLRPLKGYRFSPHSTLFYDGPIAPSLGIDPISWTAKELVLVHSLHGRGQHRTLKRWRLSQQRPVRPEAPSRSAPAPAP